MKKILIITANFYKDIGDFLVKGAVAELEKNNFEYEIINLSGALEIPAAITMAQESNENFAGYIALGCVIRGETSHYDYVCAESARGLGEVAIKEKIAIGNGILTCENMEQALERARMDRKNKGGYTAKVCLEMIKLRERFCDESSA